MVTLHTSGIGNITIIHLAGRLDSIDAPALQVRLFDLVNSGQPQNIILNMEQVQYLSAAGLRVLRNLQEKFGKVRIANPSRRVMDVLQITGLDVVYPLFETQTEAVHSIRPITNAHTHLELGWLRAGCPDLLGMDFVPWILERISKPFNAISDADRQREILTAIDAGIKKLIESGITVIGDVTTTGASIPLLLSSGLRGVVYVELLATHPDRLDTALKSVQDIIAHWRPKERHGLKIGLSLHTPYSVHPDLFKKALDYATREALPVSIHVAESPAETEFMLHGKGDIADQYFIDARPRIQHPGKSSVAYLEDLGALAIKPLLIHAVHVDDDDIARIKQTGCTVVHCPRSNLRLRAGRMPLEKMLDAGIPVVLGTDSLVSAPSLSIFDELEVAVALHHRYVKPEDVVKLLYGLLPGMDDIKRDTTTSLAATPPAPATTKPTVPDVKTAPEAKE
jgi:aminodeoxyfutalosine deaminase